MYSHKPIHKEKYNAKHIFFLEALSAGDKIPSFKGLGK